MSIKSKNREFKSNIDNKLHRKLSSLGFVRNKNTKMFYKDLGQGKFETLLLDYHFKRSGYGLVVNPIMGFVHGGIEKIWKELMPEYSTGLSTIGYDSATIQSNIGYVLKRNDFLDWKFSRKINRFVLEYKLFTLITCIRLASRNLKRFTDDNKFLPILKANKLGLTVTNRFKCPILLCYMGKQQEGLELVSAYLLSLKPTPKDKSKQEPDFFASPEEAREFFKRDKDPKSYYNYALFFNRFVKMFE